ncbi:MAG: FAD-dependent oxidoreductase [Chlamydiota bacterium]
MAQKTLIVIGAGAAGLVVAIGAAKAGKKVLLIDKGNWGGDCTNFGCIPSKSLIASAHAAHAIQSSAALGINCTASPLDTAGALKRLRGIVSGFRSHENPEELRKLGIDAIEGAASFVDPYTIQVTDSKGFKTLFKGKKIVIATGSSATIPPIEGLEKTPYLTNETLFALEKIPPRLIILGGGPIGCEMAQAMQRLGCQVELISSHNGILMKEDGRAQKTLADIFVKEGIRIHRDAHATSVSYASGKFVLKLASNGIQELEAEQLLVAVGRRPQLEALNLPAAGISFSSQGISVDAYGRTNQSHIFAIGDVTGKELFTHAAEHEARAVLSSLLLPWNQKIDSQAVPRVTFTDPEVASVGLNEKQALQRYGAKKIAVYTVALKDVDRAVTAGETEGFVIVITKKWSSRIVGACIVAPRAGEMLMELCVAMHGNIPLRTLARIIHPYPTYSLAIRKAADLYLTQTLLPPLLKIKTLFRGK